MNILGIEDALYDWVSAETGIETIFAYPSEERPKTQYALINVLSTKGVGEPISFSAVNGDGTITITKEIPSMVTISFNIYYADSFNKAKELKKSLEKTSIFESLYAAGLGLLESSPVQKIPEQIDKKWEERGQFDADFSFIDSTVEILEQIESIEVTNNIAEPSITTTITKE
jgi:hypothetical protein